MREALAEGDRPAIIVIDAQPLRLACLVEFLRGWAEANRVHLAPVPPDMLTAALDAGARYRLGLLNLGGAPVDEPASLCCLKELVDSLPGTPVAVISDNDDIDDVVAALRAGAQAFIPTSIDPPVALQALSFIMGGGSFFPPAALLERFDSNKARLPQGSAWTPNGDSRLRPHLLTARQEAVLAHLRGGKSNKAIAKLLGMQESTVKVHMRQIMKRLGVANRTQAALTVASAPASGGPPSSVVSMVVGAAIAGLDARHDVPPAKAKPGLRGPMLRVRRPVDPLAVAG